MVGGVFVFVVVVQLVYADAVGCLLRAGAAVAPIVGGHAVFRTTTDVLFDVGVGENGKVGGEVLPISGGGLDSDRSA